jgi:hydrogenase-4 component B
VSSRGEWLVLAAIVLAAASGVPGLFVERRAATGERIAAALMTLAAAAGLGGVGLALGQPSPDGIRLDWPVPGGAMSVRVDAISAMFLIQIFVIGLAGSVYGLGYWRQAEHPDNGRKLRLFYGLLTAGMGLLVVARNTVLFLAGWEMMALAAFFVVTTEDDQRAVREVGYLYLAATRLGTLCLFAMFALLSAATGALNFVAPPPTRLAGAIFLLAISGFGLKAGIMPLHVWLPGAHANAPSHVSAMMSGVLIKMGIYGLVRVSSLFAHPPLWWGGLVLALGVLSATLGVAFAIGQHDLKRLLAYHSVENIGIIWIGLGAALLGRSLGRGDLVALGLAGALLHTWNHGLFKALLFLSAGSVAHATRTREIDQLGGLARAMPWTGSFFLVGAVAICGLPPLNGFVSELLVYLGLFRLASSALGRLWLVGAFAAPALALVGALAVACFVKVYGVAFLGEPRSDHARRAHESGPSMLAPMAVLTTLCVFIGFGAPLIAPVLERAVTDWVSEWSGMRRQLVELAPLGWISIAAFATLGATAAAAMLLNVRIRARARASSAVTWDCGYARPTATMQYTSSSFGEVLVGFFAWALRPHAHRPHLTAVFPRPDGFHSHVPETVLDRMVLPFTRVVGRTFQGMRWIQHGSVHRRLLYNLVTLMFFFLWR